MPKGSGRKPLPAALLDPKKSKISKDTIEERKMIEKSINPTPKNTLKRPSFLSGPAKKEWNRIMKLYEQLDQKILSDLDQTALVMYCEAVAAYKTFQKRYKEMIDELDSFKYSNKNMIFEMKKDDIKYRNDRIHELQTKSDAILGRMNRQIKNVNNLAEQLCLTPVARAKIGILSLQNKEEGNPVSAMFDK
jgi:P27 family predicted phage terminase small subunit